MTHQLDQLEREAEAQRALFATGIDDIRLRIAESADNLRDQLSPGKVVRRTAKRWRDLIEQNARENPLQVVGVAALVGYPLWHMARALPLPMVIAGAGVLLARKAPFSTAQVSELLTETGARAQSAVDQFVDSAKQLRDDALDEVQQVGMRAAADASNASVVLNESAHSAARGVKEHLGRAADNASAALSVAAEAMTPSEATIQNAKDSALAAASAAKDITSRAVSSGAAYSRDAANTVAQNPLLVAGLGLAAGGLLAAFVPRTTVDSQLLGGLARTLETGAKRAVKNGHEAATKAVEDFSDRVADEAEAHGLTPKAIRNTADDFNERIGEAAATTKPGRTHKGEPS